MVQFTSAHIQPQWRFSKRQASHGRVAAAPLARQSVCKGRSLILLLYTTSIVERISKRVPSCSTAQIREHIFRAVSKGLACRCWRTCPSHDLTVFLGYGRTLIPYTTVYYILCAIFSVYTILGIFKLVRWWHFRHTEKSNINMLPLSCARTKV